MGILPIRYFRIGAPFLVISIRGCADEAFSILPYDGLSAVGIVFVLPIVFLLS